MEYLCHAYFDKTGTKGNSLSTSISYIYSCAASRPKQKQVSRKHRSSLQIENDKKAKRQKSRTEISEERTTKLKKRQPTILQKCQMKMQQKGQQGFKTCSPINKPEAVKKAYKAAHLDWKKES